MSGYRAPAVLTWDGQEAAVNTEGKFDYLTLATDNVSISYVKYGGLEGLGDSKRNKGERRDSLVGHDISVGRALLDLGNQLIARGHARLDCDAGT